MYIIISLVCFNHHMFIVNDNDFVTDHSLLSNNNDFLSQHVFISNDNDFLMLATRLVGSLKETKRFGVKYFFMGTDVF